MQDRAARAARREEALALEREKRLKKEPTPPPSVADPVVEVPTMHEDPIDVSHTIYYIKSLLFHFRLLFKVLLIKLVKW